MTTARVVEALDEREHREPRLGLRLEPAPVDSVAKKLSHIALS
jgi:hypothetical protein